MKTKILTTIITLLLLVGLVTALPVANVQAWGCRRKVTYFTGTASFAFEDEFKPNPDFSNAIVIPIGDCILTKGIIVKFHHNWVPFGEGINVNDPLNKLLKADGTQIIWGRHVLTFPSVTLTGYFYGKATPDGQLTARYVSWGNGYKVIWRYEGDMGAGAGTISGVIIET
ncbi:hypothetical protein AC480_05525 [miscellaneous Crenarchaeota group archaeon SMTZ1-55]|nr:MAG: hypothetical protein AC480_05525 [miscellaneous Crenarchaeota group archaeon SMTZ1-55]